MTGSPGRIFACIIMAGLSVMCTMCSGSSPREPGRYYDPDLKYSIKKPEGWTLRKGDGISTSLIEIVSPWESAEDVFSDYVSVDVERFGDKRNLDEFFEEMVGNQAKEFDYFEELRRGDAEIGGRKAKYIVFDIGMKEGNNRVKSYVVIKGRNGFLISCVAERSKYEDCLERFEDTVSSFRFE